MAAKIAIVDIETTGPSYFQGDRIIQMGIVTIENGELGPKYSQLINPLCPIPSHISHITGITDQMVEDSPRLDQVVSDWFDRLQGCIFIAHNLHFDLPFLRDVFMDFGLDFKPSVSMDTLVLAKILLPTARAYNLSDLAQHFDLPMAKQVHDALIDATITASLLQGMAGRFSKLPRALQTWIKEKAPGLPNDEAYFFENYQQFISSTPPIYRDQVEDPGIASSQIIGSNLSELLQTDKRRLILKTPYHEGDREVLLSNLVKAQIPFIYVLKDDGYDVSQVEKVTKLRRKSEFISESKAQKLFSDIDQDEPSQWEWMQLMGLAVWLDETQDGLIEKVHNDLNINHLLEKFGPKQGRWESEFFNRYLKQAQVSPYLVVAISELSYLEFLMDRRRMKVSKRRLIIENFESFHQQFLANHQQTLSLSQLQSSLHQLSFQLKTRHRMGGGLGSFLQFVDEASRLLASILGKFELKLLELNPVATHSAEDRVFVLDPLDRRRLTTQLKQLNRLIQQMRAFYQVYRELEIDLPFNEFTLFLRRLDQLGSKNGNVYLASSQFRKDFYQYQLVVIDLEDQDPIQTFFADWKQIQVLDHYYIDLFQELLGFKEWFANFQFLDLSKAKQAEAPLIELALPLAYLADDQTDLEEADQISLSSTYHQMAIKGAATYISDFYLELGNKIVILAPNKRTLEAMYRALNQLQLNMDYLIIAEGMMGSNQKVNRQFKDAERAILILNAAPQKRITLPTLTQPMPLILLCLPFQSRKEWLAQVLAFNHNWGSRELFDRYLIKKMQLDLLDLVQEIGIVAKNKQVLLMDDRLFTKYYSDRLRNFLQDHINIEIID